MKIPLAAFCTGLPHPRPHCAAAALASVLGLSQLACATGPIPPLLPLKASSGVAAPSRTVAPLRLKLGIPVDRELDGAQPDEISLSVETDQYVRLVLDQRHLDVAARLFGPAGEMIVAVDGPGGKRKPEFISLVTATGGEYRLVVTPHLAEATGHYTVKLEELRVARPEDSDRVKAEAALSEAVHVWASNVPEDLPKALSKIQESLSLWKKIGDWAGEIQALLELGTIQFTIGDQPKALASYREALSLSLATNDRSGKAEALMLLAGFDQQLSPETRVSYFENAFEISRDLGEVGEQGWILYARGGFELNQGKHSAAMVSFQEALGFAQSAGDNRLEADIWNGIGVVHSGRGESREALECYGRAIDLARQEGDRWAEGAILTSSGLLLRRRGELHSALAQFLAALDLNQHEGRRKDQAWVLLHLGGVYLDLGDTDQALKHYEKALSLSRAIGDRGLQGLVLNNIGQVYLALKEWRAALESFEQAWILISETGNRRRMAATVHNLGVVRLNLGETAEAIQAFEKALPLRRDEGDRLGQASTLLMLGEAYHSEGDPESAALHLNEALEIAEQAEAFFVQAAALLSLAKLERDRGDLQKSLTDIERSIQILELVRSNLAGDRLRSSFLASRRSYYDFYVDLLMRLHIRYPAQDYQSQALKASEQARARSLLDLLAEGRLDLTGGISPELKRQEADMTARLSQIQGLLMDQFSKKSPNQTEIAELHVRLDEVERERQKIEWQIRSEYPRYTEVRYPSSLGRGEIQKRLPEDTALLEYLLGEEGSYVFVVTRDRLEVHRLPGARWIADEVRAVRDGVKETSRRLFSSLYAQAAYRLYQTLIAPARPLLAGKRHLLISPDGPLHVLPFEVLLMENHQEDEAATLSYLLWDFSVSYTPSASVLSWLAGSQLLTSEGGEPPKQFLAFADPLFSSREENSVRSAEPSGIPPKKWGLGPMPRLIGTAREVQAIAALYSPSEVQVYKGEQANEANIKSNPLVERARRLHFATHGVLNERQPELSGLRLTRTAEDDGILQVHEIFNLNLKADLVVLSACNTGLGKEVTGEGLVGLTRAFLYAGTPSVVVSLWEVVDTQTPALMLRFYEGLDKTRDKAEALRQAKLEMIRKKSYATRPFFWAPFILVGRP
jgi:CHAT domain-containing protein/tetratricopeptide (TPR) repeat protein